MTRRTKYFLRFVTSLRGSTVSPKLEQFVLELDDLYSSQTTCLKLGRLVSNRTACPKIGQLASALNSHTLAQWLCSVTQ